MQEKVKGPAIGLMVTAVVGALLAILGTALQFTDLYSGYSNPLGEFGPILNLVSLFLNLAACAFIFYGAMKMKALESWGVALAANIVAMIPLCACCLIGLPVGIWGLVVLLKPEVKEAFTS